jgi:hypothetical protein
MGRNFRHFEDAPELSIPSGRDADLAAAAAQVLRLSQIKA